jgi:hypothetical protein
MPCSAIEHFEKDNTLYEETGKIGYGKPAPISIGDILILYAAIDLDKNTVIGQNKAVAGRVLGYCECKSKMKYGPLKLSHPLPPAEKREWDYYIEVQNLSLNFSKKSHDKAILDIKEFVSSDTLKKMVRGFTELKEKEATPLIEAIQENDQ